MPEFINNDIVRALAEDYENICYVQPETDSLDVVKLDGFATKGKMGNWRHLSYSEWLNYYAMRRVYPEDRVALLNDCSPGHLAEALRDSRVHLGCFRIYVDRQIHFYEYKVLKVSEAGEPLRAVIVFRNVDFVVSADAKMRAKLQDMKSIMDASEMGTWHITLLKGTKPRMTADSKMRELLGIDPGEDPGEEEIYDHWFSRIDEKAMDSVDKSVKRMISGQRDENTYKWHHPTLGVRFVRCGGTAVPIQGGYLLSGYHYDVTVQVVNEMRSNMVIKSLAHSYEYIYYVRLYNKTYITYRDNVINDPHRHLLALSGDFEKAVSLICEKGVSPAYQDQMRSFSDVSTINERMKHRNVLLIQFKDQEEVWHEWSYIVADRTPEGDVRHLIWTVRQIDDEMQAEIRRKQLLEDNIAANKAKTMFLQNMSHEIRTPLNAMYGFAQLLGFPDGAWSEEEKEQYNSYIENSFNMLVMLIDDIIDIADSEHGNYRVYINDVNVNTVCRNALMLVDYRRPIGVDLRFTSDLADDHVIRSDGRRIQQVLVNYLTNACKYTSEGEIHLHCSTTENPGRLTFSVTDTGSGIPADKADIIFNRFTKLNKFKQGSGLGLNICMLIAGKLGGEVYLDKSYTSGARFVFVIDDVIA